MDLLDGQVCGYPPPTGHRSPSYGPGRPAPEGGSRLSSPYSELFMGGELFVGDSGGMGC